MVGHCITKLKKLCSKARNGARRLNDGRLPFRPRWEVLEARTLPSTLFGLTDNNIILRFDSATPGNIQSAVVVSGLQPGELLKGIDFRPATGQLFALGILEGPGLNDAAGRIYTINLATGAATAVATGATPFLMSLADNAEYGFDFNPASGGIRIVNSANQNMRVNPTTGSLTAQDTTLAFTAGDTNVADDPAVVGAAYDQNFSGTPTTTLFAIDLLNDVLVRQGGVNGSPPPINASPNQGELTTIGSLGVSVSNSAVGFDTEINPATGASRALATLNDSATNLTGLFTINLGTGAATLVGTIANGAIRVTGLAIAPYTLLAVGADAGSSPQVRAFDGITGEERFNFLAYDVAFKGGVRVAVGDVNRDGVPDIVTAAGAGGGPHVRVFNGINGAELVGFFAYAPGFSGGVTVAVADVNGNGFDDIITGAGPGGGPHVQVFDVHAGLTVLQSFFAYDPAFGGGVQVGAGDINFDGRADIITGAGAGGGPHVKVFSGQNNSVLQSFFAYHPAFTGGVYVAAGDVTGDGRVDIITGAGTGGSSHVRAFSTAGGPLVEVAGFFAYPGGSGVRVAAVDTNGDGRADIVTGSGPGLPAQVKSFDGLSLAEVDNFFAFSSHGGVFVGGGR